MSSKFVAAAAALIAAALTLPACQQSEENSKNAVATGETFEFITPGGQTEIRYAPEERKPLQEFSGEDLMNEGETISLSDFDDQIVVLNSWGQWCAPCRSESDDLQRVHEKLQEDKAGTVFGINVRDYNPQISRDFKEDNGLEYPSIYDPPFKTAAALGGVPTAVVPTTIVLDKQHRPAAVFLREITDQDLLEVVEELEQESA
ncbi:TlpA disulfide reductase family protein [Corynebacterium sp. 32222D000AT]|uniref:TlpA disulfide reductase family protein n=1 Tax=unclassified Corynebacterium TaxID=2624378 RepID=UPI002A9D3E05|nr:TlpA disulfide reductase family protein [Mycobacteriaceae bacterium]MDY5828878.1 TlpA disulfide reductase family protein [Corynebacterium sp.]